MAIFGNGFKRIVWDVFGIKGPEVGVCVDPVCFAFGLPYGDVSWDFAWSTGRKCLAWIRYFSYNWLLTPCRNVAKALIELPLRCAEEGMKSVGKRCYQNIRSSSLSKTLLAIGGLVLGLPCYGIVKTLRVATSVITSPIRMMKQISRVMTQKTPPISLEHDTFLLESPVFPGEGNLSLSKLPEVTVPAVTSGQRGLKNGVKGQRGPCPPVRHTSVQKSKSVIGSMNIQEPSGVVKIVKMDPTSKHVPRIAGTEIKPVNASDGVEPGIGQRKEGYLARLLSGCKSLFFSRKQEAPVPQITIPQVTDPVTDMTQTTYTGRDLFFQLQAERFGPHRVLPQPGPLL